MSNLKFTTIMYSILSDIFKINHEHNTIEFVTTRLGIVKCTLTLPEKTEDWRIIVIFKPILSVWIKVMKLSLIIKIVLIQYFLIL
jgi:hypothetical protein